jgi:hypothetical protein
MAPKPADETEIAMFYPHENMARNFAEITTIARNLEGEFRALKHNITELVTRIRIQMAILEAENDALKNKNAGLEAFNRDQTAKLQDIRREKQTLELKIAASEAANGATTKTAGTKRKADNESTLADNVRQRNTRGIATTGSTTYDPTARQWAITATMPQHVGAQRPTGDAALDLARDAVVLSGNECAWCLHRDEDNHQYAASHRLKDCVWPTPLGEIPGCPVCNTMGHFFDHCPTRGPMSENERREQAFAVLVRPRGGLPPIRTSLPWPQIAADFGTFQLRAGYPATKAFVRAQMQLDTRPFRRFHNATNRPVRLLQDPATASMTTVAQNFSALVASEVFIRFFAREDLRVGNAGSPGVQNAAGNAQAQGHVAVTATTTTNPPGVPEDVTVTDAAGQGGDTQTSQGNAPVGLVGGGSAGQGAVPANQSAVPPSQGAVPANAGNLTVAGQADDSQPQAATDCQTITDLRTQLQALEPRASRQTELEKKNKELNSQIAGLKRMGPATKVVPGSTL